MTAWWRAVREDDTALRPESYTDEFQRLRLRAGLRRIKLHGLPTASALRQRCAAVRLLKVATTSWCAYSQGTRRSAH